MGLIVTCEPDGRLTPGQLLDFILELDEETMAALQGQHRGTRRQGRGLAARVTLLEKLLTGAA
jgi:hypothetical protein